MPHVITEEAFDKLRKELNILSTVKRHEIAERIQRAKELGDLSENAEYSEAKDAQAFNEGRISELTALLKDVNVIRVSRSGQISLGSKIKLLIGNKIEKEYQIVSFNEADPMEGKISNESPIGSALLGHKKGDKVLIDTPKGKIEYEILEIK